MNLIDDKLTDNGTIIYHVQRHWAILLGPILVIIIGGLALRSQGYHAVALIAFGLLWGVCSYINVQRSEIVLTQNKILMNVGFPMKRAYDIPLSEITFIDFYQPSLGSMLNFGKVMIVYQGKKKCVVRFVSGPADFVREVQRQMTVLKSSPA